MSITVKHDKGNNLVLVTVDGRYPNVAKWLRSEGFV